MGAPLYRLICHCKTCQQHYDRPYNDECGYLLSDVKSIRESVELKSYQTKLSPLLRGRCKSCNKASYSLAKVFGGTMVMVPSEMVARDKLPVCSAHVYYDRRVSNSRRVNNSNEPVRKYSGHILSQLYIQWVIVRAIMRRKFAEPKAL
ncbi:MAG: GFA family protein [Pseudomonadales bacterium]|nr:GFA family protein [Pseudomonadales bacterium]